MSRKRKPLSQLTLEEAQEKKSRTNINNGELNGIQPRPGTIRRMILKNFMCHSHLEVTFDHNINYVIGRNGSGKSAILTALVVGLGGKASLTNRGNSIKSFIKAGKNSGSVEVTVRNEGPLSYRYKTFGNEITIVRNFTSSGSSSYKIKAAGGEVISSQSKEIQRICSNLNIQIDNPICLLNQDTSRNFLNSKDPHQKFLLFMRATHLQNLLDEYKKLMSNKKDAIRMLGEKEVLYSNLRSELNELKRKVENYKSITSLKDQLTYFQREFYWAKVRDSNDELQIKNQAVLEIQEELASIQDEVKNHTEKSARTEEKIQVLQQKVYDLQESVEFQNGPQNALTRSLGELKEQYSTKKRENRIVLKDIAVKTGNCNILQQELDSLKENFSQAQEEKMQRLREIATLEEKLKGVNDLLETTKNDQFQIHSSLGRLQEEEYNLQCELQQTKVQMDNTTLRLNSFKEESNTLSLYGRDMPRIIDAINAAKSKFVHLPRGPLGSYITLKDKKWAVAVEGFFGAGLLRAFAVDNKKDSALLMKIFDQLWSGSGKPMVITSKFFFEVHDISSNIVKSIEGCLSVYSALEISDPVVANCLIDQTNLESVLLIPDTNTAIELMSERQRVPRNCQQGITIKGDKYYPDPNYKTYGSRYHTAQFLQVSTADMVKHLTEKLKELHANCTTTKQRHVVVRADLEVQSKEVNQLEIKVAKLNKAQLHLKRQLNDLNSTNEPDVANVQTLESELAALKVLVKERQNVVTKIGCDVEELNKKIESAEAELEKIKNVCRGYEDRIEPLQNQIREETTSNKQYKTNKLFATKRLQEFQNKLKIATSDFNNKREIVRRQTDEANMIGEELQTERNVTVIVEEIQSTQRTIAQVEAEVESAEDLNKKYQGTCKQYEKASEFMKSMCQDVEELKTAADKRARYYKSTEDYFISYVKHSFKKVLELRQFKGSIEIDVQNKTLDLIVKPQQGSQGYTSTSNLSGGERSFSTVAFLYSLWQCMEFPFYILDEFDVFMDKVNRTKVMEILLHHAKSFPDLQFVFLTPQDVSFVNDKAVTIHRLEDPERAVVNGN